MRGLPRVESRIKLVSSGLSWDIPHLAFPIIRISHSGRVPGTIDVFSPERKTHKITNCPSSEAMCGVPSHSDHISTDGPVKERFWSAKFDISRRGWRTFVSSHRCAWILEPKIWYYYSFGELISCAASLKTSLTLCDLGIGLTIQRVNWW